MWNLRHSHWSLGGSSSKQYGGLSVPTTNTRPVSLKHEKTIVCLLILFLTENGFEIIPIIQRIYFADFRIQLSRYSFHCLPMRHKKLKHSVLLHVWNRTAIYYSKPQAYTDAVTNCRCQATKKEFRHRDERRSIFPVSLCSPEKQRNTL